MIRTGAAQRGLGLFVFLAVVLIGGVSQAQVISPAPRAKADVVENPAMQVLGANLGRSKEPLQPFVEPARTPSAAAGPGPSVRPLVNIDPSSNAEVEPNGTSATATPLPLTNGAVRIYGNIYPNGDLDFYSFSAAAGDRVYVALQTSQSASASNDSVLELYGTDGTTLIEGDEDDGSFGPLSSSIAGATIPAAGTYFVRVRHNSATTQLRPYTMFFQLRSGTPVAETEANDTAPGQPMPAGNWVSGATASATDADFFSVNLNAGDTVFLSLDQDPERNGDANLQLGMGVFDTLVLVVNDSGAGFAPYTAPDSEAFFLTVKDAGTYSFLVAVPAGGVAGTYNLSASVFPAVTTGVNCTTYTSTNVPVSIPDAGAAVSSTITVPGNPRIADLDVAIQGTHTFMADLDVHLVSPAGNDNGLFTDVFNQTNGGRSVLDVVFDDEAATPPSFQVSAGYRVQPELNYRLSWFDGENAGGTWTLVLRDDVAADVGTLTGWSMTICEAPPPPACAPGFAPTTVFSTDFESGAAGFTHSGTQDEWELGLPATLATTAANPVAAFNSCASGVNCWKTDLDNTYNASSVQDLRSPTIDLTGLSAPVVVRWAQRYQMDTATNDHYNVSIQPLATPGSALRLFEHLDAVMTDAVGTPLAQIGASAGWGFMQARADSLAGGATELVFHLDSGTGATNFGGAAIDDVSVSACRAASADLAITKTDGVTTATPGGSVTYTITASNAGTDAVTSATVADTFPAILTCNWTCVGAGGGTCTAAGSGNINDAVNLPVGGSVTYTASCGINASATGSLSNTATVLSSLTDPDPANNSATDTDTLTPQADLSITNTDGVTTATPGGSVTYTITSSNAGLSNAPGSVVADNFPAALTCTWTCVGAGGGTCTAAGSGNINDTVNLPAGGSVTHTASCTIDPAATGTLSNTATVAPAAGVTDYTMGNNSATDTDTLTPGADLAITKTDGVTSVTQGGSTTYTITASNSGPSSVTGATVADTFPASLTCNWTCVGAGGGTCTASGSGNISNTVNLPSGASVTYTAICAVAITATGTLSNTATVTAPGGATDPNPANNSATDSDTINPAGAALDATKTVSGTFTPGSAVTYTVVVNNSGGTQPDNPGNEFTDVLPAQLSLVSATSTSGTAVASVGANTVTWNGTLANAGSVTITINATILPGASGTVSNQGTVSFDGNADGSNESNAVTDDPGVGGTSDPTTFLIGGPVADLSITKTDGSATATPGGSTTYTLVASNAGPSSVSGASVSDTFVAGLTCNWTCTGAGGGTCTASGSGNIADTVNLPSGGSVTYSAVCAISAALSGNLVNTASVAAPAGANDPNPANNSATDTDTLAASADVSVTKTDGVTSATAGGSTTYTVVVANAGPSDAAGVTVTDTLPPSLTCTWTCAGSAGGSCSPAGSGSISDNANLPGGASVMYSLVCAIDTSATGSLVNSASAAVPAGVTDPATGNNSATDTDALGAAADLSVTKTDGVTNVLAGATLTYTIVASNAGPSSATGATLSDTFPAECVAPTWTCAATGGASCTASGSGAALAESVNLPVGSTATFSVICPVNAATASGTLLSNTASIAAPAGVTDTDPGNNSATDTTTVVVGAGLSASKSVTGGFLPGTPVTYSVVLSNSAGPQPDNPGDELTDVLPAQLTLVSATASSGTAVATTASNTVTWNGALPAGGSVTITIVANINTNASGTVVNQASFAFDADANGSNESTGLSDDPGLGGAADATAFSISGVVPGAATPVPALGWLGLLLAALGLLALGWHNGALRRVS